MCWARPLIGHFMPSWTLIGRCPPGRGWGDAPGQASVSSVKWPLLSSLLLSPHVGHNEQSRERRGEWRRRQYKVHHYWLLCPCCASFRFLSGLVVTDSFVSEYSAHVTCVSFVAQSVLLPNWNVSLRTLTQQFVKFEFNMTLNCIHICGQTVKAFSYG